MSHTPDSLTPDATLERVFSTIYYNCDALVEELTDRQEQAYGKGSLKRTVPDTELMLMKRVASATVGDRPTAEISARFGSRTTKLLAVVALRHDSLSKVEQPNQVVSYSILASEIHAAIGVGQQRRPRQISWRVSTPPARGKLVVAGNNSGESLAEDKAIVASLDEVDVARLGTVNQAVLDSQAAVRSLIDGEPTVEALARLEEQQQRLYYGS